MKTEILASRAKRADSYTARQGIHVSHVIIDGVISGSRGREHTEDKISPDAIAEEYWRLHTQDRSAWTHELDLRPFVEKF